MLLMKYRILILNRCVHSKRTNKLNEIRGLVVLSIHSDIVRRIDKKKKKLNAMCIIVQKRSRIIFH